MFTYLHLFRTEFRLRFACLEVDQVNLATEKNVEGMNELDIDQFLTADNYELSNEELMNLDIQCADRKGRPVEQTRSFTLQKLCKTMSLIDEALEIFSRNDPERERKSRERSPKIAQPILSDINCNKEMYLEKPKKSVLQILDNWLKNVILFTEQECRGSSWLLWAHFLRSDPLQSVYMRIGRVVNGDQCGNGNSIDIFFISHQSQGTSALIDDQEKKIEPIANQTSDIVHEDILPRYLSWSIIKALTKFCIQCQVLFEAHMFMTNIVNKRLIMLIKSIAVIFKPKYEKIVRRAGAT
uniref:Uncharacterized protein n=1 Tax=Glossina austeni TaxID=7395 RepID=A0A1A9VE90_GLOAU